MYTRWKNRKNELQRTPRARTDLRHEQQEHNKRQQNRNRHHDLFSRISWEVKVGKKSAFWHSLESISGIWIFSFESTGRKKRVNFFSAVISWEVKDADVKNGYKHTRRDEVDRVEKSFTTKPDGEGHQRPAVVVVLVLRAVVEGGCYARSIRRA